MWRSGLSYSGVALESLSLYDVKDDVQTLKIGIKKHDVTFGMDDDNLWQVVCLMYQY